MYASLSAINTLLIEGIFVADSATDEQSDPATKISISEPKACAAVTTFKVDDLSSWLSCSAITKILMRSPSPRFLIYQPTHLLILPSLRPLFQVD